LAYVTGLVNQELLLENEYLAAENRISKAGLQPGWRLSDGERATLAEIGKRLGRKGLQPVARLAKPDTILAWYRRLVAEKFKQRRPPGRAPVQRSRIWWFAWRGRTPAGATTGLWAHWPIWGIRCPIRPWAISCAGSGAKRAGISDDSQMPRFVPVEELFKGRHFNREIVVLCVRWYWSFKLSYRDLVAMMGERGIGLVHTTILRWVQHYTPELEKRWSRFSRTVGGCWRMDETYVKVRGQWVYLYRAVD